MKVFFSFFYSFMRSPSKSSKLQLQVRLLLPECSCFSLFSVFFLFYFNQIVHTSGERKRKIRAEYTLIYQKSKLILRLKRQFMKVISWSREKEQMSDRSTIELSSSKGREKITLHKKGLDDFCY